VEVAQPEQTAAEPAQPRATTRRVRARRPAGAPDFEAVVDEQAATDLAAGEPTVVDTAVADPVPVPDASIEQAEAEEVAAPRVVTTTRRRVARRPAGRPVVTETATAEPVPESAPQEDVEPAAPTIVTTTRRRGASRPAGPPQEAMTDGTESGDVLLDDGQPTSPHVPVKKKGSRKH
jgi:ribonuclease E